MAIGRKAWRKSEAKQSLLSAGAEDTVRDGEKGLRQKCIALNNLYPSRLFANENSSRSVPRVCDAGEMRKCIRNDLGESNRRPIYCRTHFATKRAQARQEQKN